MAIRPSDILGQVKLAMTGAATKASVRRLTVVQSSCQPGCSACCSRLVYVSLAEAIIMQEYLVKNKTWESVREDVETLLPLLENAQPVTWFQMNQACPVLDKTTRLCRAYEVRPTPCSVHFVTSDPALCDPWSTVKGEYKPLTFTDLHEEFLTKLNGAIDANGIFAIRLPIPSALLLAEKIQQIKPSTEEELTAFIRSELA